MNLRAVLWLLSRVVLLLAGFLLVPAGVSALFGERSEALWFVGSSMLCTVVAVLLGWRNADAIRTTEGRPDFFRREGLAAVGLSWLLAGVLGALPYLLTGAIPSPADAFFESVSGFTTTGATILTGDGIAALPKGVAFWRSFTHWLGGIGIVLVFVVLFPTGGRSLFRSEVPGIAREAVQQRVRDSAIGLARIYLGLTMVEVVALMAAGLDLYEASIHAFGTIATGGFSNHPESVAYFASWTVESILVVFMFLAGINFAVYDNFLRLGFRRGMAMVLGSTELRAYVGMIVGATLLMAFVLWFWGGSNGLSPATDPSLEGLPDYSSLQLCVRDSLFASVSIQTSTGYGTADFHRWPELCRFTLMFLALVGACAGSTGGGLKVVRFMIVARAALRGVLSFSRPRAIHPVRMDGETLDEGTVASVTGFFALWCLALLVGTAALAAFGMDLISALTGVLACLNNIGPGLETVGPSSNFAHVHVIGKGLLAVLMILGRLEFYALVVLLVPRFWRS
ncbi:MAG: TrkH family potassium uptake protein [Planctomycetota bacterium]